VLYLLAGTSLNSYNLWEVTAAHGLKQLTFNPKQGISAFGASAAGIVLADDEFKSDLIAILTKTGPRLLRSHGTTGALIHGSEPTISDSGAIGYVRPPPGNSTMFTIWLRASPSRPSSIIYQNPAALSGPVTGPGRP
jgi:hypothetical protein